MSVSSPGGEGCLVSMAKVVDARLASSGAMISNVAVLASSTCSPTCVGQRKRIVVEGVFRPLLMLSQKCCPFLPKKDRPTFGQLFWTTHFFDPAAEILKCSFQDLSGAFDVREQARF